MTKINRLYCAKELRNYCLFFGLSDKNAILHLKPKDLIMKK